MSYVITNNNPVIPPTYGIGDWEVTVCVGGLHGDWRLYHDPHLQQYPVILIPAEHWALIVKIQNIDPVII